MAVAEYKAEEIYEQYHDKVRNYIQSKINDSFIAEDLCSDVFLKVYEKFDTFDRNKSSISTWIFTITRNTLTDYYRTRRVFSEIPETMTDDFSVEENVCNEEMLDILANALEQLEKRQRDIIILRYYSGLTLRAIAEKMDISYAYIKVLHNKALSALKEFF